MKSLRKIRGDRTGLEQLVKWVGVVGIVVLLGLLYVWQQIQTRDLKQDLLQLEERKILLIKENSRLQVQVSHLSDQEAIAPKAKDLFALNYPVVGQVVAMTMDNQNTTMAYVPLDDSAESFKSTTVVLPLASVSISQMNHDD